VVSIRRAANQTAGLELVKGDAIQRLVELARHEGAVVDVIGADMGGPGQLARDTDAPAPRPEVKHPLLPWIHAGSDW
jgi:hypothetical protein